MDCASVYEDTNPTFRDERFLRDFEIFALDDLTDSFELKKFTSCNDIESYVRVVSGDLGHLLVD